jgi:hypothetical protein
VASRASAMHATLEQLLQHSECTILHSRASLLAGMYLLVSAFQLLLELLHLAVVLDLLLLQNCLGSFLLPYGHLQGAAPGATHQKDPLL